jgi:hypothetical protein
MRRRNGGNSTRLGQGLVVALVAHYYEGAGHNLDGDPAVGTDFEEQIAQCVCARVLCSGSP